MEKSYLESLSQKLLYTILYVAKTSLDGEKVVLNDIEHSYIVETFESAINSAIGTGKKSLDYIDIDFIFNLYVLNVDKITTNKAFADLTIPEPKEYSYDVAEYRVQYVETTYRNTITSYSKHSVAPIIQLSQDDGNFDYYDGTEVSDIINDSEIQEVNVLWRTIKEFSPDKRK
jgi:hypothetical protein